MDDIEKIQKMLTARIRDAKRIAIDCGVLLNHPDYSEVISDISEVICAYETAKDLIGELSDILIGVEQQIKDE